MYSATSSEQQDIALDNSCRSAMAEGSFDAYVEKIPPGEMQRSIDLRYRSMLAHNAKRWNN